MGFHLGKPVLVMIVLAIGGGVMMAFRQPTPRADLVLWCFAESHASMYRQPIHSPDGNGIAAPSLVEQFKALTGLNLSVQLISLRAEDIRLVSLFMSQSEGGDVPDLCEIEIGSVGKYFRPPVDDVGLLPLNDFLQKSGGIVLDADGKPKQEGTLLASRLAPYSKRDPRTGRTIYFGFPHDIHPTTICYRKDLYDEAGVDLESVKTWPEFHEACLRFQAYWTQHGHPERHACELARADSSTILLMLQQEHLNVIDADNGVHLADPKVAKVVAFYAQMVSGPRRVGYDTSISSSLWTRDVADGNVCACIMADWRVDYLKRYAKDLAGKMRLMALPRFDVKTDTPTASWGGTMLGIPRRCRDPEASWKALEFLMMSPQGLAARRSISNILPAVKTAWADPAYHQPDPYFAGNQSSGDLFVQLAGQMPERYVTPFSTTGQTALVLVLSRAVGYVDDHGSDGLEVACAGWLKMADEELRRRVQFGTFDQ